MLIVVLAWLASARPVVHEERLPDAEPPVPMAVGADPVYARGAALYRTASCAGCHSPPFSDATHTGGGRDLPTIFGVFYAPNISPHPTAGIGGWSEADFTRALREGRAPDGRPYWPTFPYMTYTRLTDEDVHALWVYVSEQPPVDTPSRPHEIRPAYRSPGLLGVWRSLAFRPGPLPADPERDEVWHRGRYLVRAVSYCDQCHTPRNRLGLPLKRHDLAGGANLGKFDIHPNLTPHPEAGIGRWTVEQIATYLATARKPDGTVTSPDDIMAEKIRDGFSYYDEADRRAIAVYLRSVPADDFDPAAWPLVRRGLLREERRR